jgi:hypothetical protein
LAQLVSLRGHSCDSAVDDHAAEIRAKIEENLSRGIDREIAKQPPPEDLGDDIGVQ